MSIPKSEFVQRVERLRALMKEEQIDTCFIYGDEYRRENLRYLSNTWPIFERGAILIPSAGDPIMLGAPEGEQVCREMSAWDDIRLVPEFACVTVPDEIEYPFANYTTFKAVFSEIRDKYGLGKVGISGIDAMPNPLYEILTASVGDAEIVDMNNILYDMRLSKSENEVGCLLKAIEIADAAYTELMCSAKPGVTELELSGIAIGTAMKLGAEYVPFCLVSSGERVNTIIGRATGKVIEDGEMVMAALAVQYEGYIATFGFPFVVGTMNKGQKQLITWLFTAFENAVANLKAGVPQNKLVSAVKKTFSDLGISQYDLYPPLHGCGLSEAESPYPNENVSAPFVRNMTVNTDISLFGHEYGSNRIETSLVVTEDGYICPSKLFGKLIQAWKEGKSYLDVL